MYQLRSSKIFQKIEINIEKDIEKNIEQSIEKIRFFFQQFQMDVANTFFQCVKPTSNQLFVGNTTWFQSSSFSDQTEKVHSGWYFEIAKQNGQYEAAVDNSEYSRTD